MPDRAAACALSAGRLAKGRHAVLEAESQLESCLRLAAEAGGDAEPSDAGSRRASAWS